MFPIELTAINKAIDDKTIKAVRDQISVGDHEVDITVRIKGRLTVGENYEQYVVVKADPWTLLAIALSKLNGITIQSIVNEALTGKIDTDTIKKAASEAIEAIKKPTLTECFGKITTKLSVIEIENIDQKDIIKAA